jgi:hypothetical protein
MTPEMKHDLVMLLAYPVLTALLNGLIALAGKSGHPAAKVLAAIGTSLLSKKSKPE